MKVPDGVNYLSFYEAAKAKGIKIQSRHIGVSINIYGKRLTWLASYNRGKSVFIGRFPFTRNGEDEAGAAYKRYLLNNGIKPKTTVKRKSNSKSKLPVSVMNNDTMVG